ncbi:hypothetical protein NDU88_004703 [Pleurodeles waltl]|uniref:Uncharacterized protein n=1 Tax=Pleurodeles waltl TaxID=8319 RepID=A0AAV7WVJ0_PLEWA|nr:hypothetical protein NDU88_004703 [Pleurodeles waltl]
MRDAGRADERMRRPATTAGGVCPGVELCRMQSGRADVEARDCSLRCVAGCRAASGGYLATRPSRSPAARSITVALPWRRHRWAP